jgi:protein-L-isoaspartate(D-aspartate) O-methyltransferase
MRELDCAALLSFARLPDLPLARAWMCNRLGASTATRILAAMQAIPRHAFIPHRWRVAYTDLSLWTGATWMTRPRTVARVLAALPAVGGARVMEIGTGSGYQTALLAALGASVTSFEIAEPCTDQARRRLDALGAHDVVLRNEDGLAADSDGPLYDAIVVNAALSAPPISLFRFLDGGRGVVVAPVTAADGSQRVLRFESRDGSTLRALDMGACLYAPAILATGKELP